MAPETRVAPRDRPDRRGEDALLERTDGLAFLDPADHSAVRGAGADAVFLRELRERRGLAHDLLVQSVEIGSPLRGHQDVRHLDLRAVGVHARARTASARPWTRCGTRDADGDANARATDAARATNMRVEGCVVVMRPANDETGRVLMNASHKLHNRA